MDLAFQQSFTVDINKKIGIINNLELVKLEIELPNIQRLKDSSKIDDIVNYQDNYYKSNGNYNFLGVINIHYNTYDKKYYLVDGQHRFFAIKKLTNMGHKNINVSVELITVLDIFMLKKNYELINKNTELPEFPDSIDKNIPEIVANDFFEKYNNIWSTTRRVRRPHINKNNFQESLGVLTEKLNITESVKLKEIVENYNEKLKCWSFSNFPGYKTFKDKSKIENKCQTTGLYLGLFPFKDDDYGYGWVKSIIHEYTGKEIKPKRKYAPKIPNKVRIDSWNKNIGEDIGSVLCICCATSKITQNNFHAGHINAKSRGGKNTVENILPICAQCNGSMMTENMGDYINQYYPDNYSSFITRNYKSANKNSKAGSNTNFNWL